MRSFRRLFIILAEITQIVSLIVWTVGGTWAGARAARIAVEYDYFRDMMPLQTARLAHCSLRHTFFRIRADRACVARIDSCC